MNLSKSRIAAIVGTILIHAIIFFLSYIYSVDNTHITLYANEEWPPRDSSEILFGGEYVMAGDVIEISELTAQAMPANTPHEETAIEAEDLTDAGTQGTPTLPTPSTNPSPMQVLTPTNEATNPGATNEVPEQAQNNMPSAQQEHQMSQSTRDRIDKMKNWSGKKEGSEQKETGKGNQGSQNGEEKKGSVTGTVSANHSFGNRNITWSLPKGGDESGSVVLDIKVSPKGKVLVAKKKAGSTINNKSKVDECISHAYKCIFSEAKTAKDEWGTITYIFR